MALVVLSFGSATAQPWDPSLEWRSYGGTNWSQKYSPLDHIDSSNFESLSVGWTWKSVDIGLIESLSRRYLPPLGANGLKATPLVVNGVMYLSTALAQVVALDPATGETQWVYNPEAYTTGGNASIVGPWQTRGVAYWSDGAGDERILLGTHDGFLIAVNAQTGRPINSFGVDGKADLHTAVPRATRGVPLPLFSNEGHYVSPNSPPVVVRDTVVSGAAMSDRPTRKEWPPGSVQGFDARTGELKWIFHTIPQANEFGEHTWEDGSNLYTGNANVWSTLSGDDALGHVYVATTAPTNDYWGGERKGDNLFSQSIVAVDVETGERVWHFQAIHHGVWDWDFPTAPTLMDLTVDDRPVSALAQVSKQGFVYVFDRATGKPVWPIEERAVPSSDVPGEELSPTQPFPTKPPPFEYQGATEDLLIDFTPELRAEAVAIMRQYRYGPIFTPQTLYAEDGTHGTLQVPGSGGGANWGGAGADPETGFLYVPSRSGTNTDGLGRRKAQFHEPTVCAEWQARAGKYSSSSSPGGDRPARPATVEAALQPADGVRYEPRRDRLADTDRRWCRPHPKPPGAGPARPAALGWSADDEWTARHQNARRSGPRADWTQRQRLAGRV